MAPFWATRISVRTVRNRIRSSSTALQAMILWTVRLRIFTSVIHAGGKDLNLNLVNCMYDGDSAKSRFRPFVCNRPVQRQILRAVRSLSVGDRLLTGFERWTARFADFPAYEGTQTSHNVVISQVSRSGRDRGVHLLTGFHPVRTGSVFPRLRHREHVCERRSQGGRTFVRGGSALWPQRSEDVLR